MKALAALAGALALLSGAALADGGITVKLPDVSNLSENEAKSLIAELANVNVITSNCADYSITDGEWTLITGTGDLLAAQLGLDASAYDKTYYGPAFKLLDDPAACDRIGPTAKPLIQRLIGMGGGTTPLTQSQ
ncbi:hypothetical protein F8A10_16655 [Paracoccus kondratievae]|uniref:Uncharacterized protein n=1 Tax=Paracoccus kondratievae TaxID=135740 RepID=A0AAD3NW74_9RHOB|nr:MULTISPECIES: hypothetical protein [Paracoccus]QFQ89040.1 hypothetical protein F8A10_16655 [Paracoccus kondratievae]GLK62811.1 hypothetical protein GCM10017635_02790 [Paracoccus kondratievae]SMG49599.1 hypothetical protein SAMN02746000_03080 [Paracoccus sp. J56]